MKKLDYNPPTFFWIARYKDGEALSQYHPDTGIEIPFSAIDHSRLESFGWFPFNRKFQMLILEKTGILTRPSRYRALTLVGFKPDEKLVARMEQEIIQYAFHRCLECGNVWQFQKGKPNPRVKLARSMKAYVEKIEVTTKSGPSVIRFVNPICPSCSYHDTNAVMIKDKRIKKGRRSIRFTKYVIGVKGEKLQFIDQEGKIGKL